MQKTEVKTIPDADRGEGLHLKLEPNEALLKALHENAAAMSGLRDGIKSGVADVKAIEVETVYHVGHKDGVQQGVFFTTIGALIFFAILRLLGVRS